MRDDILIPTLIILAVALGTISVISRCMGNEQRNERIETLEKKVELLEEAQYQ